MEFYDIQMEVVYPEGFNIDLMCPLKGLIKDSKDRDENGV